MHRPRDVVSDGEMVEHVPDEHAHTVIWKERQARHGEPRPHVEAAVWTPVWRLGVGGLPCVPPGEDADRVPGLELDPAFAENVVQFPAVHGRVLRHMGYAPMPW